MGCYDITIQKMINLARNIFKNYYRSVAIFRETNWLSIKYISIAMVPTSREKNGAYEKLTKQQKISKAERHK